MTDIVVVQTATGPVIEITQSPVYTIAVTQTALQTLEIQAIGPQGIPGTQGPQGPQGIQGPPGTVENALLDGGNF